MKKPTFEFVLTVFMIVCITVSGLSIAHRLSRLEKDVEDLRMRVIYGVKP